MLENWFLKSDAWRSLRPGPRALYVELKYLYNGNNNGELFLSVRDAGAKLNVSKDTAAEYFKQLQERGFIRPTVIGSLGVWGSGKATLWELEEFQSSSGTPARKSFLKWQQSCKTDCRPKIQVSPS
jgi:DNA-binding transcriptional MocR family regulator